MSLLSHCLPPTSSLPPIRLLDTLTEEQISSALRKLHFLYCPLRMPFALRSQLKARKLPTVSPTPVDSGYASRNEDDDDVEDAEDHLAALRADVFERNYALRWLTAFIVRADELWLSSEETRLRFIDDAASVLASFSDIVDEEEESGVTRDFSFALSLPLLAPIKIKVQLNDATLSDTDHTDVGLQSWGASIVLADLMCSSPACFQLEQRTLGSSPRIIELGAGTGLVSLTLATLLPHLSVMKPTIIATDYHSAVLANLRANIATNFASNAPAPVQTCFLDWSAPSLEPPLDAPANILAAADVIYAPEHAVWLRDCAARLLAPEGAFWLIATVRPSGKFVGITDTVEAAFAAHDCPRAENGRLLTILKMKRLEKRSGVGRGDEIGYRLYRIGWT